MLTTLLEQIELRNAMHRTIYSDNMRVGYMVELLNGLDLFNITFNDVDKTISLKVKKTNIKKIYGSNYRHDCWFYLQIIDPIFRQVILKYKNDIAMDLIRHQGKMFEALTPVTPLERLANIGTICTVNVLLDNMVIIKL